jgi:DNA-binding beta-propeller fold protein YncE
MCLRCRTSNEDVTRAGAVCLALAAAIFLAPDLTQTTAGAQGQLRVPRFVADPMWNKPLPHKWTTGQVSGVAVDSHDHVWIVHRPSSIADGEKAASFNPPLAECCIPAPPILEFDPAGNMVNAFGGPGADYEWPATEHGIFVDHKDNVWTAGSGRGDAQILKFTNKGKFLLQIGRRGQSKGSNDTQNLGQPAGIFVHAKTNELFVADGYGNRRVIVFDAETGAYRRHWGAYGRTPEDTPLPPRAQIIQGPPPALFNNPVHSVVVSNDDLVYVADRGNNRLQVFALDGTFVREAFIKRDTLQNEGTVHDFGFSPDKEQRFLYVVDGSNKWVRILNRKTLEIVDSVGGRAGHGAQEFFHIHSMAVDSKGNIYLGEVNQGQRYMKYAFKGMGAPANPTH